MDAVVAVRNVEVGTTVKTRHYDHNGNENAMTKANDS